MTTKIKLFEAYEQIMPEEDKKTFMKLGFIVYQLLQTKPQKK